MALKQYFKVLMVALTLVSSLSANAALQEGAWKGKSEKTAGFWDNDVMSLLIRKDPNDSSSYYAVLAEYERWPMIRARKAAIVNWVNRIAAYRITQIDPNNYAMKHLTVSAEGKIVTDEAAGADLLTVSSNGPVIYRYEKGSSPQKLIETIELKGKVNSTWEPLVVGRYFGSKDSSGADYRHDEYNMEIFNNNTANFFQDDIVGQYAIGEEAPGMFVFKAISASNRGDDKLTNRIGVFIDIVNWKPHFTSDELLLINPENESDVGFYYERH